MSNGNLNMAAKGRYGLSILDKNGEIKKEKSIDNNSNVVTYEGAFQILLSIGIFNNNYAAIGTGTTEIVRTASSLGMESSGRTAGVTASRAGNEIDNGDGTSTVTLSRTLTFSLGSKVGTFSEVGLYTSSSGGTFIAGQLIKDEFGIPTTITVLSDEQLVVTYILEWTVPNNSQLIGSGSVVDSSSNSYDYEFYAQPYFGDYAINDSGERFRYKANPSFTELVIRPADGITSLGIAFNCGANWSFSHNGTGTATASMNSDTLSPSSVSFTDAVYIGLSFLAGENTNADILDLATTLGKRTDSEAVLAYLKFINPISKTTSQSFQIGASFTITL